MPVVLFTVALSSADAYAQPASAEQHVRGDVTAVNGNAVEVKTRAGAIEKFTVGDATRVSVASKADPKRIAKNAYVGTTAVPEPDGTLRALEVHVFPESARGAGEGHRPWDLQAGSSMTSGTVAGTRSAGSAPSSMTNATVSSVQQGDGGLRMTLRYKDGQKTVVVPAGTPVVELAPADRSRIVPGAHVFAAVKDGSGGAPVADRIVVGQDVPPPM